jgi:hypothetical protein
VDGRTTARPALVTPSRAPLEGAFFVGMWLVGVVALAALSRSEPSWSPFLCVAGALATCALVARYRRASIVGLTDALRPRSWATGVVGVAVAASLVVTVMRLPGVLTSAYDRLAGATASLGSADVAPLATFEPLGPILAAARTIPPGATFAVDYGDHYPAVWPFIFWLAPRVYTSVDAAAWVIVYGEPIPTGLRFRRKVRLGSHVYALETVR